MCHSNAVRFHGVPLAIVVVANVACIQLNMQHHNNIIKHLQVVDFQNINCSVITILHTIEAGATL